MKIRKFKHKKTGHIFEQDGSYYNRPKHELIPAWLVEDSNDWEEIIEKDYEILSYYAKNIAGKGDTYVDPTYIWKQKSLGQWSRFYNNQFHTGPYSTEAITNHNGYGIHSIRRISDGEIFTIGDIVQLKYGNNLQWRWDSKDTKLEKLEILNGELIFYISQTGISAKKYSQEIKCWKKYIPKQPLFTTEDGVDIFEGDKYVKVLRSDFLLLEMINADKTHNLQALTFSTKEKAQEYIDLHKPKYSLNDIAKVLSSFDNRVNNYGDENYIYITKRELKKLNK